MARKEKNIHYLYKTTCNVTGRWYIGMHSTDNIEDGYMGSGLRLRRSIRKYGVDNHTKEILEFSPTREVLILRETEIVNKELIADENCMNLKEGGTGGFSSEEHKIKFFTDGVKTGREKTNKLLKEKFGDNFQSEIGKIFRISLENDEKLKTEWILKTKIGLINAGFSEGTFKNKNHSQETKLLMSESSKGQGIGETNSQYGTCWITKDGLNKKIKKEELDSHLNEGWIKGRK